MNKVLGILIVILYFAGYHICDIIYPLGGMDWYKVRHSIYCLIILLAIEYKKQNLFIEKLFCAIVFNDIYVLLFNNETTYSINDAFFIAIFTLIQYIKTLVKK